MWNYEIVHFLKENEWSIRKVRGEEEWWLSSDKGNLVWTYKQERAKRFYHKDTAISALVVVKTKGGEIKNEEEVKTETQEKQSWSEFSA